VIFLCRAARPVVRGPRGPRPPSASPLVRGRVVRSSFPSIRCEVYCDPSGPA